LNPEVLPELETIVLKALAKEPESRYSSAADFQVALEDLMSQKGYGFSAVRLSQHLQTLFARELEQDTYRFRSASGAESPTDAQDRSTVVRRTLPREATPTRMTGSFVTPMPRARRKKPVVRTVLLALCLLFFTAVWAANRNFPMIQKIENRFPAAQGPIRSLARMPELVSWIWTPTEALDPGQEEAPDPVVLPGSEPPVEPVSPVPAATPAVAAPPARNREPAHRSLTPAQQAEIQKLFDEARADYSRKRLYPMEQKLRRIIELDPRLPMAHHLLAMVFLERNEPEVALRLLQEATKELPGNAVLHYDLGFLYYEQGVVSLARQELNRALELSPKGSNAEKARGIFEQMRRAGRPAPPPDTGSITVLPEPAPSEGAASPAGTVTSSEPPLAEDTRPPAEETPGPTEEAAHPNETAPVLEQVTPIEPPASISGGGP
jgi:tetratricopeptide (TPR) repeat protein